MLSKVEAEKIISERLDVARLRRIIKNTSIVAWKKQMSDNQIDKWLGNFRGKYFNDVENERKLALWLLAHFSYYTYDDVRVLCRNIFNQYLHVKLQEYCSCDLEDAINEIIDNTVFIGLGNDSESGNNILYYFRQENELSKKSFKIEPNKIYENIVYVDDVTMSGEQAVDYIKGTNIPARNVYAALLIATESAVKELTSPDNKIKTFAAMTLDERDRVFSESTYVFSDKRILDIRLIAQEFCEVYGRLAAQGCGYMEYHPLGFKNGQYMIGFEYNIPDNTLPIFWGTGDGWNPLFKRYPKIYEEKEYVLDGRKYY